MSNPPLLFRNAGPASDGLAILNRRREIKVKYFPDTDTLLVSFSDKKIAETRDLDENILLELDENGHVVGLTIEHAKQQMDVNEFSYQLAGP